MWTRAFVGLGVIILLVTAGQAWRNGRASALRAESAASIRSVVDPTDTSAWVETFDAPRSQPLEQYDSRWQGIFGRVLVEERLGAAIGDPDGGWQRDGGDDYAFRPGSQESSAVRIVVDGWWDGQGSIGALGAVQANPPHRFYEATLWRGRLALNYFVGPRPEHFEVLAESAGPPLGSGFYRLVFCLHRSDGGWRLSATLQDPVAGYRVVRQASVIDARLGNGSQGIGLLGSGGQRGSRITGMVVSSRIAPHVPSTLAGCGDGPTTR
jgi:hypothetical protein